MNRISQYYNCFSRHGVTEHDKGTEQLKCNIVLLLFAANGTAAAMHSFIAIFRCSFRHSVPLRTSVFVCENFLFLELPFVRELVRSRSVQIAYTDNFVRSFRHKRNSCKNNLLLRNYQNMQSLHCTFNRCTQICYVKCMRCNNCSFNLTIPVARDDQVYFKEQVIGHFVQRFSGT